MYISLLIEVKDLYKGLPKSSTVSRAIAKSRCTHIDRLLACNLNYPQYLKTTELYETSIEGLSHLLGDIPNPAVRLHFHHTIVYCYFMELGFFLVAEKRVRFPGLLLLLVTQAHYLHFFVWRRPFQSRVLPRLTQVDVHLVILPIKNMRPSTNLHYYLGDSRSHVLTDTRGRR